MSEYSSPAPGYAGVITCPYNKCHQILPHRMQTHLVKCRKSYPDVRLKACIFNASHLVPDPEYAYHLKTCIDRGSYEAYKYNVDSSLEQPKQEPEPAPMSLREMQQQQDKLNNDDEDWDNCVTGRGYDPKIYVSDANVIRQSGMIGMLPSERKAFREEDRLRLNRMFSDNKQ